MDENNSTLPNQSPGQTPSLDSTPQTPEPVAPSLSPKPTSTFDTQSSPTPLGQPFSPGSTSISNPMANDPQSLHSLTPEPSLQSAPPILSDNTLSNLNTAFPTIPNPIESSNIASNPFGNLPQLTQESQPSGYTPPPFSPAPTSAESNGVPADFDPSKLVMSQTDQPDQPPEPAPTDLPHPMNTAPQTPEPNANFVPPVTQAETLVLPSNGNGSQVMANVAGETHSRGLPKWVIGLSIALLLIVAGASAYFILGIGQSNQSISLPATIGRPQPTQQPTVRPVVTPQDSGGFGNLNPPSPSTQSATSAADLLRQRRTTPTP